MNAAAIVKHIPVLRKHRSRAIATIVCYFRRGVRAARYFRDDFVLSVRELIGGTQPVNVGIEDPAIHHFGRLEQVSPLRYWLELIHRVKSLPRIEAVEQLLIERFRRGT
jgi:hypothetical protein